MEKDYSHEVKETPVGSIDSDCIELVIEATRFAFMELHEHYLVNHGDGPQKGLTPGELFMSFFVSTIYNILHNINKDDAINRMHLLADNIHEMANSAATHYAMKEAGQGTKH